MKLTKQEVTAIIADCLMNHDASTCEKHDRRHGGPFDRGGADSYYHRSVNPHYFIGGTGSMKEAITNLDENEIRAYMAGYIENEESGDHKVWD